MTTNDDTPPAAPTHPRPPNPNELRQLADWLRGQGYDREDADSTAGSAFVAVYDHYTTGGPGHAGKLMSVVWDGSPSFFDVFTWEGGGMARTGRDEDAKACDRCGACNGTLCRDCWRQSKT